MCSVRCLGGLPERGFGEDNHQGERGGKGNLGRRHCMWEGAGREVAQNAEEIANYSGKEFYVPVKGCTKR